MKTRLTRFSVALTVALLMSSLSVLAKGKRPPTTSAETPTMVCSILMYLHAPHAALNALGCYEEVGGGEFED